MKLKSLRTSATLIVLLAVSLLTFSCNSFDERLPECRLLVKFKYDYNMLHTDAFHTQVDRVELYIFDKDGRYLFSQVEEGEVLATGYYTMEVKLPVGEYQLLAWAGAHDSYEITIPNGGTTLTEMKLQLMREESLVINKELEPLWYGGINHVKFTGTANQMEVINLIKDTNKIRFIFQGSSSGESRSTDTSGWTINMHDYDYEIITPNGRRVRPTNGRSWGTSKENFNKFAGKFIGQEIDVLFEQSIAENTYEGLTPNYIRVIVKSDREIHGEILKVKLTDIKDEYVEGTLV